jgi:hypothetical protein
MTGRRRRYLFHKKILLKNAICYNLAHMRMFHRTPLAIRPVFRSAQLPPARGYQ